MGLEPSRLSKPAESAIREAQSDEGVAISSITLWELASLLARRRIQPFGTIENSLRLLTEKVAVKPITLAIAAACGEFPRHYSGDPADRIIGATARVENMSLVTKDQSIRNSGLLHTIW
jgi:Uncharacterized protein conserved in bacteria